MRRTCIDRRDDALYNDDGQSVHASQGGDDLAKGGQLGNHVEEQGEHGHEAKIESRYETISLTSPLGENKALWAFPSNDGTESSKDQEG